MVREKTTVMPTPDKTNDPYHLGRFVEAQEQVYSNVLAELSEGCKRTHWMWFIFPQLDGLGSSPTAKFYAIKDIKEAREYLQHPLLGPRLLECAKLVLGVKGRTVSQIFIFPDDLKFRSSMTLFSCAAGTRCVFDEVLEKCFGGGRDGRTLELLGYPGQE
jgi:uncharacterized protein (DUF1810 family)